VRLISARWMKDVLAPYHGAMRSNIPAVELSRQAPALEPAAPPPPSGYPAAARPVTFGRRRADGSVSHDVELLGYSIEPQPGDEIPWLRVRYTWRVNDP